uniref:Uncharacterized protein n=1 Tax=Ixodes ricinus TaxID=34613 RepID=A0A147BQV7_IXORI
MGQQRTGPGFWLNCLCLSGAQRVGGGQVGAGPARARHRGRLGVAPGTGRASTRLLRQRCVAGPRGGRGTPLSDAADYPSLRARKVHFRYVAPPFQHPDSRRPPLLRCHSCPVASYMV